MAKSKKTGRPDAQPYKEKGGTLWCMRPRYEGHENYLSGYKTKAAVKKAANKWRAAIDAKRTPKGLGPDKTTVAQSLQDYALDRLPFMKGARQEARRLNVYLRLAGLGELVVTECPKAPPALPAEEGEEDDGAYFKVTLGARGQERVIPQGLGSHRKALLTKTARTEKYRAVVAEKAMSDVTRDDLQAIVNAMRRDRTAPATIWLERSMFRVLFNHAAVFWNWPQQDNPATKLKMPKVDNAGERVMSAAEQVLLDAALGQCRNELASPVITLLRETGMRASEPLEHAVWGDVNWERRVLSLSDAKAGRRLVPLSPVAIEMLHQLGPGLPGERIVKVTYEALRAAMSRACERAGISGLTLKDLRRTAGTRLALKTGNIFLVKALLGHKGLVMPARYMRVGADDVVDVMHASQPVNPPAADEKPKDEGSSVAVPTAAAAPAGTGAVTFTLTPEQLQDIVVKAVAAVAAAGPGHPAPAAPKAVAEPEDIGEDRVAHGSNVVPLRRAA